MNSDTTTSYLQVSKNSQTGIALTNSNSSPAEPLEHDHENEPNSDISSINVDRVLEQVVKPCGLWQWSIVLLMACGSCSLVTFPVYANSASAHRCAMEPHIEFYFQNRTNLTFDQIASKIGPWYGQNHSLQHNRVGCFRFHQDWGNLTGDELVTRFQSDSPNLNDSHLESCPRGYVFDVNPKTYPENVVREFETVCDRAWLVPLGTSVFMSGMSMGFLFGGWTAGRFGRRRTILLCALLECLSAIWTCVSPNYLSYILSRAVMAIFATAKNSVGGVLMIELTVARYRSTFKTVQALGMAFFHRSLLALLAYCIPNWRWLNAVAMAPNILGLTYIFFVPESPRWLMSQNRTREALKILEKGYRLNHLSKNRPSFEQTIRQMDVILPAEAVSLKVNNTGAEKYESPSERWSLIRTTVLSVCIMFGLTLSFIGILFYARVVRDYVYLVGFLNALMAVPGTILYMLCYRYFARRRLPLLVLCVLASGILTISALYTLIAQPENDTLLTIGSNAAFVLILASLCMGTTYVPELFPSLWRSQGHGTVMGLARIGGILCAFVNELDRFTMHGAPLLIYAGVLLLVALVLLFLPDTKGENLPDR